VLTDFAGLLELTLVRKQNAWKEARSLSVAKSGRLGLSVWLQFVGNLRLAAACGVIGALLYVVHSWLDA
jgi:hypothetical protein